MHACVLLPCQAPGVDDFYRVVLKNWGHQLPDLSVSPKLDIVIIEDLPESEMKRVKMEIPDVITILDEDEDGAEQREFSAIPFAKTEEEIETRLAYISLLIQSSM